ncbi:tRNA (adenosine(37)-N6)-threonylcarbamoyltransferase complex ATPase subunit type 1 TsaE [Proteiniclasticum sp.]|uniref:tRNA (adenosine(37)-N6)-threonylcarbamoyltransferase complex ATPase subunit type 1 TsaE n=1 Tax=Proteiniclasticum sp. TaxID=2053595 RepID=UPI0037CC126A
MIIKFTESVEETMNLGRKLGTVIEKGSTLCLTGDLGTGKTHFAKGFAKGLGIKDNITSPTFTIVNEYDEGRLPFYHFDVYRVNDIDEILQVGFEEYVYGQGVTLIEWADMIEAILPEELIHVKIEKTENPDERKITIRSFGKEYDFLEELQ